MALRGANPSLLVVVAHLELKALIDAGFHYALDLLKIGSAAPHSGRSLGTLGRLLGVHWDTASGSCECMTELPVPHT